MTHDAPDHDPTAARETDSGSDSGSGIEELVRSNATAPMLVTMQRLAEDTAGVLASVNNFDRPAVVTRHGRFVAVIHPLVGRNVEGKAIAALMAEQEAAAGEVELTSASEVQLG